MSRISEIWNLRRREIILGIIIFLVASLSFGLGYLSNKELTHNPIVIEKCSEKSNLEAALPLPDKPNP